MTAHAMKGIREKCLAAGMDDYVSKPIRDDDLLAAIQRVAPVGRESIEDTSFLRQQDTAELMPLSATDFDEALVLGRVGGNREILQQLIAVFYQDCNNLMDNLNSAIRAGNATGVRAASHTLKGMVSFFGAKAANDAALKLEQAGKREELAEASQMFSILARELVQLESALISYAPSPPEGWHLGLGNRSDEDIFSAIH
jgi:HPt (histidine-containing phosphotransfer) domain-containing protein